MDALAEPETRLTAYLLEKLAHVEGVQVYGITDPARAAEKVGAVPLSLVGVSHYLLAAILSAEGGIGVRNGCFCAHPYILNLLNVSPEQTLAHQRNIRRGTRAHLPGLVRISFGCYNNEAEVDWLIEVLTRVVRGEYRGRYVQDPASGAFWPQGYAPPMATYFTL